MPHVNLFHNSVRVDSEKHEETPIMDSDGFNTRKYKFLAHELTRPHLMELKLKSENPRNKIIQEIVYIALLLKDT